MILYRLGPGEPLVGTRWDLDELASMFDPSDPVSLAGYMWESQVDEPDKSGRYLDVDWADLVADRPGEVLWFGPSPNPDQG